MSLQKHKRIIISGGGTGGHIFPALAIADALRKTDPSTEILFVGAEGRMEMEKMPAAGYKIIGLPVSGFDRKNIFRNIKVLRGVLTSLKMAERIIEDFDPDVVVGVGGYASGPLLRQAGKMNIPALIQEQNSYAGITNRLLAPKASVICVAYDGMEKYFPAGKIIKTGNPVRHSFTDLAQIRPAALDHFGLNDRTPVVLILGGSLGAGRINNCLLAGIEVMKASGFQWLWQTGKSRLDEIRSKLMAYEHTGILLHGFIERMDYAYSAADVIVSRSGAGTISELCLTGKPVILVPSPNVAEDHQTKNAMVLARNDAAFIVRDNDAEKVLLNEIIRLVSDKQRQARYSANIIKMAERDADVRIANEVLKLAGV